MIARDCEDRESPDVEKAIETVKMGITPNNIIENSTHNNDMKYQ